MWVGNLMLVVLNLPMIGMVDQAADRALPLPLPVDPGVHGDRGFQPVEQTPRRADHGGVRILGYICVKLECEPAPMILGFTRAAHVRRHLRRSAIALLTRRRTAGRSMQPRYLGLV